MPQPKWHFTATSNPIPPIPTIPNTLFVNPWPIHPIGLKPVHSPLFIESIDYGISRAVANIKATVKSAVTSFSIPGVCPMGI